MPHSEIHSNAKLSVKDCILAALRPVAVGAALLLSNEQRVSAQSAGKEAIAAPPKTKTEKQSHRQNAMEIHRPSQQLDAEQIHQLAERARAGSPDAQYDLARTFEYWSPVLREIGPQHAEAEALYRKAASAGHAKAQSALADFLLKSKISNVSVISTRRPETIKEVFALLESASEKGEASASYRLATLYLTAKICDRNAAKAAELLERAILQGCPFSPFQYLALHMDGEIGFEPDLNLCERVLRDAASKGRLSAKSALGQLLVTRERFAEAQPLLEAALPEDIPDIIVDLATAMILRNDSQRNVPRGKELILSVADRMDAVRLCLLAGLLADKKGCNDLKAAARLLKLSADRGFAPAQYALGRIVSAPDAPAGYKSPRELFSAAASGGYLPAIFELGVLELKDSGFAAASNDAGMKTLQQGSERGFVPCDFALGIAYTERGNYTQAERHLRRAWEGGIKEAKDRLALALAFKEATAIRQPNTLPPSNKLAEESAKSGSAIGAFAYSLSRGAGVRTLAEQADHARRYLEISANRGCPLAFLPLGEIYLNASRQRQPTTARHANQVATVKWLTLAARADSANTQALNLLRQVGATSAARGQGIQQADAFRSKPAEDDPDLTAILTKSDQQFFETLKEIEKCPWRMKKELDDLACKYSDAESLHLYALFLLTGLSGQKELAPGVKLLTAAAELNHPEAQGHLAYLYRTARGGVGIDLTAALKWGRLASANGDRLGQELTGNFLANLRADSALSVEEGTKWLEKAVAQGSRTAAFSLAAVLALQPNSAEQRAKHLEILRVAANRGHAPAQEKLADILITGSGDSIEITEEARRMLAYATDTGSKNAPELLALISRIDKDHKAAFAALSAPDGKNRGSVQLALGVMYENLETEEKDPVVARLKALDHYYAAASLDEREALTRIAAISEQGLAGAGDSELAIHFHRLAADRGSLESNYRLAFLLMQPGTRESELTEAHARLNIAASKGNEEAKQKLIELEKKLSQAQRVDSAKLVQEKMPRFTFSSGQPPLFYRLLAAGTKGGK